MKRLYLTPALLALGGFLLFGASAARADCVYQSGAGQVINTNPNYVPAYGAWINVLARSKNTNCETYRTSIDPYPAMLSGKTDELASLNSQDTYMIGTTPVPVIASSNTSAKFHNLTVVSDVNEYGEGLGAITSSQAEILDLVTISFPNASTNQVSFIPVRVCDKFTSDETGAVSSTKSGLVIGSYSYNGENGGYDYLTSYDPTEPKLNSITVNHTAPNLTCTFARLKMVGKYMQFAFKLYNNTNGVAGTDIITLDNGNTFSVKKKDGNIKTWFQMGKLPQGATCQSASGDFPGCDFQSCYGLSEEEVAIENILASEDDAALMAVTEAWTNDNWWRVEYGGPIVPVCSSSNPEITVGYTYAIIEGEDSISACVNGGTVNFDHLLNLAVSGWHTHPLFPFSLNPPVYSGNATSGDIGWINETGYPLYLGIPSTGVLKLRKLVNGVQVETSPRTFQKPTPPSTYFLCI